MVGPHVGPPQWFADPLAVGVAAAALGAAHSLVVQHGVDVHVAPLFLQASLRRDGESFGQSAQHRHGDVRLKLRGDNFSKQLKKNS